MPFLDITLNDGYKVRNFWIPAFVFTNLLPSNSFLLLPLDPAVLTRARISTNT